MDQKTYNIVAAVTVGIIGVLEAVVAKFNPPMEGAIAASLPVLEGAILTIAGNFVVKAVTSKKEAKKE